MRHLLCLSVLLLLGAPAARADCPPNATERDRPAAPCVNPAGDRLYTPRLDWPYAVREPPPAVKREMARVAALLQARPDILRVRIESHEAYTPGRRRFGRCVTCNRAEALVRLLVEAGVHPKRLEAQGYGEVRPLFDYRVPDENRFNHRFEWHLTRATAPALDRDGVKTLTARWRACLAESGQPMAITLMTDAAGRLATIALDRPGPLDCMVRAVGQPLAAGPTRITWPAPDRPAPHPPIAPQPPTVDGWACPDGTAEDHRPPDVCVSADGTRIWLPALPREPKSNVVPRAAHPILDRLVELLRAAPQIARVRVEMHDYRDPHARERAVCHTCRRAAAVKAYLIDHGIERARVESRGHAPGRLGEAGGAPRYAIHIEGWMPPGDMSTSAIPGPGEDGPRDAEAIDATPKGKSRRDPTP